MAEYIICRYPSARINSEGNERNEDDPKGLKTLFKRRKNVFPIYLQRVIRNGWKSAGESLIEGFMVSRHIERCYDFCELDANKRVWQSFVTNQAVLDRHIQHGENKYFYAQGWHVGRLNPVIRLALIRSLKQWTFFFDVIQSRNYECNFIQRSSVNMKRAKNKSRFTQVDSFVIQVLLHGGMARDFWQVFVTNVILSDFVFCPFLLWFWKGDPLNGSCNELARDIFFFYLAGLYIQEGVLTKKQPVKRIKIVSQVGRRGRKVREASPRGDPIRFRL